MLFWELWDSGNKISRRSKDSKQQTVLEGLIAKSKWQTLFRRLWNSQLNPTSKCSFGKSGQRTEAADSAVGACEADPACSAYSVSN